MTLKADVYRLLRELDGSDAVGRDRIIDELAGVVTGRRIRWNTVIVANGIEPGLRKKLLKILSITSADQRGEVVAALNRASFFIYAANLTWSAALKPVGKQAAPAAPEPEEGVDTEPDLEDEPEPPPFVQIPLSRKLYFAGRIAVMVPCYMVYGLGLLLWITVKRSPEWVPVVAEFVFDVSTAMVPHLLRYAWLVAMWSAIGVWYSLLFTCIALWYVVQFTCMAIYYVLCFLSTIFGKTATTVIVGAALVGFWSWQGDNITGIYNRVASIFRSEPVAIADIATTPAATLPPEPLKNVAEPPHSPPAPPPTLSPKQAQPPVVRTPRNQRQVHSRAETSL